MRLAGDIYFFFRLLATRGQALRWWRLRAPDSPLRLGIPWLPLPAIDLLDTLDLSHARVFEYGSGGSTLYWLRRGAVVTSIEHDERWYATLAPRIAGADYRLVPPETVTGAAGDPADPDAYASSDPASQGLTFRAYAQAIDLFPDRSFDIVLVDGRARPSCIRHAAPKVKPGGLLVVDNADRDHYFARTTNDLREFTRRVVTGPTPGASAYTTTSLMTLSSGGR